jgi:hypothetical protein
MNPTARITATAAILHTEFLLTYVDLGLFGSFGSFLSCSHFGSFESWIVLLVHITFETVTNVPGAALAI